MEESAWGENVGGAPLPVPRRPPIRPVGFRSVSLVTEFLIGASILQAILFVFGAWYVNDLRREHWGAEVSPLESMLLGSAGEVGGDGSSDRRFGRPTGDAIDGYVSEAERRGGVGVGVDNDAKRLERFMGIWLQFALLLPIVLIIWLTELVSFIVWQIRVHENLSALGSDGLQFDSRSSALWWFVPFVVLWKPMQIVQETWRGSDPGVAAGDELGWRLRPGSALVMCWWSLLVIAKCLYWSGLVMLVFHMTSILSPMALWVIASGAGGFASLMQIGMVQSTAKRQMALERKRVGAVRKAEAAGEPVVDADAMMIRIRKRSDAILAVGPIGVVEAIATDEQGAVADADRRPLDDSANDPPATNSTLVAVEPEISAAIVETQWPESHQVLPTDCVPELYSRELSPGEPVDELLLLTEEADGVELDTSIVPAIADAVDCERAGDLQAEPSPEQGSRMKEGL